jgi:hypothetical protein
MAEAGVRKAVPKKPGRKPPPEAGERRQILAVMNGEVIRAIGVAAAQDEITASELLEQAPRKLLGRRKSASRKA